MDLDTASDALDQVGDTAGADTGAAPPWPATRTIIFNRAVRLGGKEYAEARLVEPTVGQVEDAASKGDSFDQVRLLVSKIAEIPYGALGSMPASAYQAASAYLMHFIAPSEVDGSDADEGEDEPHQPESFRLIFAEPIAHNGRDVESITLAEPTLSMLQVASKANNWVSRQVELMAMASALGGGSRALIDKMKFSDFRRGRDYLEGFTAASAKTF